MSGKSKTSVENKESKSSSSHSQTIAEYYKEVRKNKEFGGIIDRAFKGQISNVDFLKELPLIDENNLDIASMFFAVLVNHSSSTGGALKSYHLPVKFNLASDKPNSSILSLFSTKNKNAVLEENLAINVILKYSLDANANDNFIQLKTAVAPFEFIGFLVNTFADLTREALITCKKMMRYHGKQEFKNAGQNPGYDMSGYIRARHRILESLDIETFLEIQKSERAELRLQEFLEDKPRRSVKLAAAEEVDWLVSWYLGQINKAKSKKMLAVLKYRIENIDLLTRLSPAVEERDIASYLNGENYLGKSAHYAKLMDAIFTRSCDPSLIDDTSPISSSSASDLPTEPSTNSSSSSVTTSSSSNVTTQTPVSAALEDNVSPPQKEPAVPLVSAPISTPTLVDVDKHVQLAKMEASHKHAVAGLELLKNLASIYFRGALITSTEYYRALEQLAPYENRWLGEKEWHELRDIQEIWENAVRSRPSGLEASVTFSSQPNLEGLSKMEDKSQPEETAFVWVPVPTESVPSSSSSPLVSSSTTSALDYDVSSHTEMVFNTEGIQEAEEITETDDIDLQEHQSHQLHSQLSASTAYMIASMAVEGNPSNEEGFSVKEESKSSEEETGIEQQQHAVSTPSASFLAPPRNLTESQQSISQLVTDEGEGHGELLEPGGRVIATSPTLH